MTNPCKHPSPEILADLNSGTVRVLWCDACGARRKDNIANPGAISRNRRWKAGRWKAPRRVKTFRSAFIVAADQ